MNFLIMSILILCASGLYGVKCLKRLFCNRTLRQDLEKAGRKALYVTLAGIVIVAFACVALFFFPIVRILGFSTFSCSTVKFIRSLMEALFETQSVYAAIKLLASVALILTELSLLFSIFGFMLVKMLSIPCILEWLRMEKDAPKSAYTHTKEVCFPRKLFLNFANLKI